MTSLAILLIGFSLFSALILAVTHFGAGQYQDQPLSKCMGLLLLLALSGLQLAHFFWLYFDQQWVASLPYRMVLFMIAPAFFLFSQPLLRPRSASGLRYVQLGHFAPMLIAAFLPSNLALPLAFIVGAGYLLWLAQSLWRLRAERSGFRLEMGLLGTVFAIALGVSVLGLAQASLPDKLFFSLYASAIGLAFLLVQIELNVRPQLSAEVQETALASAAYSSSTLANVDSDAVLNRLTALMQTEKLYIEPDLTLPLLAERLELRPHQLSELINTQLGKGFSRYLREQRVAAAATMLCAEPSASVLSVGMSVGFSSQSNFYQAFREIEGMTPGQYRKLHS